MWKMFDDFDMDCTDCGPGPPPPTFLIPPPPRPPFLDIAKCTEESLAEIEVCDAITTFDGNYFVNRQTSAMLLLAITLLIIFFMLVFLLAWIHRRKVQNFPSSPSKTPTRTNDPVINSWAVMRETGEDHLGHRPLVMRHPMNVETIQGKPLHYPSGYPMPRSPPLFICSSPGPEPYCSNMNIYEELENNRTESDDDVSVPGESFNKSSSENTTVATIYQDSNEQSQIDPRNPRQCQDRSSMLSYNIRSSDSSNDSNNNNGNLSNTEPDTSANCNGMFRGKNLKSATSKKNKQNKKYRTNTFSMENLKTSGESSQCIQPISSTVPHHYQTYCNKTNNINNSDLNNINNNICSNSRKTNCNISCPNQMDVEIRNRINMIFNSTSNNINNNPSVVQNNYCRPQLHHSRTLNTRRIDSNNHYDRINNNSNNNSNNINQHLYEDTIYYDNRPNILPDFTTIRNYNNFNSESPSFGRDSSFSGDSGYSQNSNRSYFGRRKV